MEARANVNGQLPESRLQLLRIAIFVAVFDCIFQRHQRIEERTAKLRKHSQALAPSGAA